MGREAWWAVQSILCHKEMDTTEQLIHLTYIAHFLCEKSTQFGPQKYLNTDVWHE